jgi:toxin ParE1/3/4
MAAVVAKLPGALADIADIWRHIAADSGDARADAFLGTIDDKVSLLAAHPRLGRARPELGSDLRSFAVAPYIIFYRALSDGVAIVRVLHGARDLEELFDLDEEEAAPAAGRS